jgi:UDP-glucose 4-epimerase
VLSGIGSVPPATMILPWFRSSLTDMRWLPINEDVKLPESAPAPLELLDRLIEEASHRVIFEACGCRIAFQCRRHPIDIGCLLMGDSAIESPPHLRREVGVTEAKEHTRRAVEAGLVPQVGKARVDNYIFGIKDRSRSSLRASAATAAASRATRSTSARSTSTRCSRGWTASVSR